MLSAVVAGLAGLAVTWGVSRSIGPSMYAIFAVFWSGLYLIIGLLFGVQQEITRVVSGSSQTSTLTRRVTGTTSTKTLVLFAPIATAIVIAMTTPLWGPASLGKHVYAFAVPIVVGASAYVVMAIVAGILAGSRRWALVAMLTCLDAVIRAVLVFVALAITKDPVILAWVVAVPIPLALAIVVVVARPALIEWKLIRERTGLLIWNSSRTVAAAAGSALLVTGFPIVLSYFSWDANRAELGAVILALTITRAPLLMPLSAFQSYLVVLFRRTERSLGTWIALMTAAVIVVMLLVGTVVVFAGPELFSVIFGSGYKLDPWSLALLVAASGGLGLMYVSGPATLARDFHTSYAVGWLVAAAVAIAMMFIPVRLPLRVGLALSVGPLTGYAIHLGRLLLARHRAGPGQSLRA